MTALLGVGAVGGLRGVVRPGVEVGAVYRWSDGERLIRLLVCDGDVVMYDAWWPHLGTWGLANLQEIKKQRISYYVVTVSKLVEKAMFVRLEPFTDDELAVHRPDLPFVGGRCVGTSWSSEAFGTADLTVEGLRRAGCADLPPVEAPEIRLAVWHRILGAPRIPVDGSSRLFPRVSRSILVCRCVRRLRSR